MKPSAMTHTVESTLQGEDVRMSIDEESLPHLMDILSTGLYEDPELAVLREYSTNAWDAHIEAGVKRPIEVELPTSLRPTLVIRDFGVGLDADDIRRILSKYGASTKRGTNEQVGALGLGCKSGLAYADQFTILGRKGGIETLVSVSRDERGAGTMKIVREVATDKPNGAEVSIPAPLHNGLRATASDFFRFWSPGSVLVDGEAPGHIADADERSFWITDRILARGASRHETDYVVMGNVAYPCEIDAPDNVKLVAWVEIGDVDFPANRESLRDTAKTRAALERVRATYIEEKRKAVQASVDAASSRPEALRVAVEELSFLSAEDLTYRGEALPGDIVTPDGETGKWIVLDRTGWKESAHSRRHTLTPQHYGAAPRWIVNFTNTNWTAANRRRLEFALGEVDGTGTVVLRDGAIPAELEGWVEPERVLDWEELRKIKLPQSARAGGSTPYAGTYPTWTPAGAWDSTHPAEELEGEEIIYVVGSKHAADPYRQDIHALYPKAFVVSLATPRKAKFLRLFPNAVSMAEALKRATLEWWDGLDEEDRLLASWTLDGSDRILQRLKLDADALNDPELAERVRILHRHGTDRASALGAKFRACDRHVATLKPPTRGESPLKWYPVVNGLSSYSSVSDELRAHLTLYINAAYAARTEENE